ncbi:MAG: hypothetical protein R3B09_16835 [Nannocystaceae bacterium]
MAATAATLEVLVMRPYSLALVFACSGLSLALVACSGDDKSDSAASETATTGTAETTTDDAVTDDATTESSGSASEGTSDGTTTGTTTDGTTSTTGTTDPTEGWDMAYCGQEPPPGAELAPPLPTYGGGGTCPTIELGFLDGDNTAPNEIMTMGGPRRFAGRAPQEIADGERLPVIFMWHWLGGDAHGFYERSEVTAAAEQLRFIAVIPESKDDILFKWPFTSLDTQERLEEEFAFFDDMLACVGDLFPVDENCVSSTGVSAGALFTAQLAGGRGQHLASIMSLSGGVGGVVKPWTPSPHRMPAMVLWGGRDDFCVAVDFATASKELEKGLTDGNHFILECIHNCAHSTPPFDVPMGLPTFAPLWMFALDHPYWLKDGESPYTQMGLPFEYPEWCSIGVGQATERVGECAPSEC